MKYIEKAKTIVIKIGSSLLVDSKSGEVNSQWLKNLAADISALIKRKKNVVIVTSGAIALGRKKLGLSKKNLRLQEKQAAAACGQLTLISVYETALAKHKLKAAQILITLEDSENRKRYLNARNTLETLINHGIVPVINENDTVATAEIRFGDNDRLAARVAQMVGADMLILLSDIDGLYSADPSKDRNAVHIEKVNEIDEKIEKMAGGSSTEVGSGGMVTKITAAKIAAASGCSTIITLGKNENPIKQLEKGGKFTIFLSKENPESARKRWIGDNLNTKGVLVVDDGAAAALAKGKSLLPAGVIEVQGSFDQGDAVIIKNSEGKEIGRGLTAYNSKDAKKIMRQKSEKIEEILGFSGRDEIIHRDDMVVE